MTDIKASLEGMRALVTGASRGIGRSIAIALAARGARIALHYRDDQGAAEGALGDLTGADHVLVQADVAEPTQCRRLVDSSVEALGGLDVLVNNAGIYQPIDLAETSYADFVENWQRTLAVNLQGPACIAFLAADHMRANGGGRIVNISSRAAYRGEPQAPAYAASKAGLSALTGSLARAFASSGIYVTGVAPGFVETDMAAELLQGPSGDAIRAQSPTGRVARPEEVANAVIFLVSPGSEFSTGTVIDVNGASYLR